MDETIRFQPGSTLMNEGESGDVAYVIKNGRVRITKESSLGPQELAVLGPGQVVGEMALVDDKPRSATATALELVIAKPIPRHRLLDLLRQDADLALSLLQVLFERLRISQSMIVDLRSRLGDHSRGNPPRGERRDSEASSRPQPDGTTQPPRSAPSQSLGLQSRTVESAPVSLFGVSDRAKQALPSDGGALPRLPYHIGRVNSDPLSRNDLSIEDDPPYQISRCHVAIYQDEELIAITDRGSKEGFIVNGRHYGGEGNPNRIAYLNRGKNALILGEEESDYIFEVHVD